jgi:hypothetical protein
MFKVLRFKVLDIHRVAAFRPTDSIRYHKAHGAIYPRPDFAH